MNCDCSIIHNIVIPRKDYVTKYSDEWINNGNLMALQFYFDFFLV